MKPQHFVSVSGGKDSQAVLCLAVERMQRRSFGNNPPRFLFADTGNEHQITLEHLAYLSEWLVSETGCAIEKVSAYDVAGLIDEAAFDARRESIKKNWPVERRRTKHSHNCKLRRDAVPELAPGCRHSAERSAALRAWAASCDCPVRVSPPIADHLIDRAVAALQPSGNAFLDMSMIHGRFPSSRVRFCTEDLKLKPMMAVKQPYLREGVSIVEWIGVRADESPARAKKQPFERMRHSSGASQILYLPIFRATAADVFQISARHGLAPNPLYLEGMRRVGCGPCIGCDKAELAITSQRHPEAIDRIRSWEPRVGAVSRGSYTLGEPISTFFAAPMVPGRQGDETRAQIDKAVDWATGRVSGQEGLFDEATLHVGNDPFRCASAYGLCE